MAADKQVLRNAINMAFRAQDDLLNKWPLGAKTPDPPAQKESGVLDGPTCYWEGTSGVSGGRSPGGSEEITGSASLLSEMLVTTGKAQTTWIEPWKLEIP